MAKGKRAKPSPDKTYYREEGAIHIFICVKFVSCPLKGVENLYYRNYKDYKLVKELHCSNFCVIINIIYYLNASQ